ncbi:MAG: hypothetical protein IKT14_06935, partial [Clostridiales bacterium]|nr:hypothetical protein [Clostridiales bacterium]
MSRSKNTIFATVFALVISLIIPFVFLANQAKAADGSEDYYITSYGKKDIIKDAAGNTVSGWAFCLNSNRSSPTNRHYSRTLLSEKTNLSDETKARLLALAYDPDAVVDYVEEQAEDSEVWANFLDYFNGTESERGLQYIVWFIVYDDTFPTSGHYTTGNSYSSRERHCLGNNVTDPVNDPDSLYNQVFVPIRDYLDDKAEDLDGYDAYIYLPDSTSYQEMLGHAFKVNSLSVKIDKTVIDGLDNPDYFNGEDDSLGYLVNVYIFDELGDRFVAQENFTIEREDGNTEAVCTDNNGMISFRINCDETVTITGFDSENYKVYVSEDSDNFGDDCTFVRVDGSSSVLEDSGNYGISLDDGGNNTITVVNRYENPNPTPVPTEPTESSQDDEDLDNNATPTESSEESEPEETTPTLLGTGESRPSETEETTETTDPTTTTEPSTTVLGA